MLALVLSTWSEGLAWEACHQEVVVWHTGKFVLGHTDDIPEDETRLEIVEQDFHSGIIDLAATYMFEIEVVVLESLNEAFNATAKS